MGWSKDVEGGEVIASAISAATRWRGWEDDKTIIIIIMLLQQFELQIMNQDVV